MEKIITLMIYEIIGSEFGVAAEDGQKVFEQISKALKQDRRINLSFKNIKRLTSAFLNVAVGQLYGSYEEEQIRKNLKVIDASDNDLVLLKRVVDTAKQYFKDPKRFNEARNEALGGDEDVRE